MRYSKTELETLILEQKKSYEHIGRMFGVTGSAIKKSAIRFGIPLQKKRKVNKKENFHHYGERVNLVNKASDEYFAEIIAKYHSWKEIGDKLGYKSKNLGSDTKASIKKRCARMNIAGPLIIVPDDCSNITKGELFARRKNWQSARGEIQKSARKTYFESTPHPKCHICGYDKHVEVAHIRAVADFDNSSLIKEINSIDNLIGLCPNHHWEYDEGILTLYPHDAVAKRIGNGM